MSPFSYRLVPYKTCFHYANWLPTGSQKMKDELESVSAIVQPN